MTGSAERISFRASLCATVVAVIGFVGGCAHPDPVESQTVPSTSAAEATVHVDVTPEHVLNTIDPDTATGAWMDDLSKNQVDNLSKLEVIQGVKNLGWGSITMRNNSELRLSAWHWNENGSWSDAGNKSG
jgi:hypothetical protein